jgi:4-hydroxybenzoate polyprenyltransferase
MQKLLTILRAIKIEHSLFALPFALLSAMFASHGHPPIGKLLWIVVAMVSARSAAMAFNRIVDAKFDASNPRTAERDLPRGRISRTGFAVFMLAAIAVFILSAALLNRMALCLSPVALVVLLGYSYTKRFTMLTHFVLGLALGMAPAGAWIGITGRLEEFPGWLCLAVLLWTAGFDIIYSCMDRDFDVSAGLHSIPGTFGIRPALAISAVLHFGMLAVLGALVWRFRLAPWFAAGCALTAILLVYEHAIVKATDLKRVNDAFFVVNAVVSVTLFAAGMMQLWL